MHVGKFLYLGKLSIFAEDARGVQKVGSRNWSSFISFRMDSSVQNPDCLPRSELILALVVALQLKKLHADWRVEKSLYADNFSDISMRKLPLLQQSPSPARDLDLMS